MKDVTNTVDTLPTQSLVIHKRNEYGDVLTLHKSNPQRYPYLLESVAKGEKNCRFDILFAYPQQQLSLENDDLSNTDFFRQFDEYWRKNALDSQTNSLPFTGGWFLFLSYELAQQVEPSLSFNQSDPVSFPVAFATRIPAAIIVDHQEHCSYLITETAYAHLMMPLTQDFDDAFRKNETNPDETPVLKLDEIIEDNPCSYLAGIQRIKNYILDGDVFQVNLSRAWRATSQTKLVGYILYQQLREANPAPFAGLIYHHGNYVISSSPERLVSVNQGYVETRPIAGTHPRGEHPAEDQTLSATLLKHPKEIAEHIMLIDLERNDLGRICQPGTVEVTELMSLESYRHVHHIVSNVRGKLKNDMTPGDVIRAVFPGGTITGCPKVRCMEIINELEQEPRGAYTGAMGYVNHDGSMDLNILIRTLSLINNQITLRAGAGIVADSDPNMELEESRAKARGLLKAIQGNRE